MAIYEIENENIKLKVDSHGAEMKSLVKKETDTEYLWNGDPAYWQRTSPILFPLVGRLFHNIYRAKGNTYTMPQHGFARDMEFTLLEKKDHEIWFSLKDTEETRKNYPYTFELQIGYLLQGANIKVMWKVRNEQEEILPFAIGGHPAFLCPALRPDCKEAYYLKFDCDKLRATKLQGPYVLRETYEEVSLDNGMLLIDDKAIFANDTLMVEHDQAHEISICDAQKKELVTLRTQAPLFAVWSPEGKRAPFICIEPWYGRCDSLDYAGDITQREWENLLEKGQEFYAEYEICIG